MINAKNELRYLLVVQPLEDAARAGFLTEKQLATAKTLAAKKYRFGCCSGIKLAILPLLW